MDETIGEMDSFMMSLLRSSKDHAYENVQSKASPIECLNETSKFYELAIILINGGLELIKEDPKDRIPETTQTSRKKTLTDLIELQDLFCQRLNHTKCLIIEKDKELIERLENEFRLRQDLESKDRELVYLTSKLEFERSKSEVIQEFLLSQLRTNIGEGKEKDFIELKNSAEKEVSSIKQRFEDEGMNSVNFEPKLNDKVEVSPNTIMSTGYPFRQDNRSQNIMIKQMRTDINRLKGILDLAIGQTHDVKIRPLEKQWRWSIEKETILIMIKGFIRDLKSSIESHTCNSEMIDEVVELRDGLQTVLNVRNVNKDAIITRLTEERQDSSLQTMAMEENYMLLVNNFYKEFLTYDIEINVREDVFVYVLREVAKEWSAYDKTESMKTQLSDEIYNLVFVETLNDIRNNLGFELQKIQNEINECHTKNTITMEKFDQSENEGFKTIETSLTEDIYMVFFRELVEDLNIERYLHELEISFVHNVYQLVIDGLKESQFFMSKNTNISRQSTEDVIYIVLTDFEENISKKIHTNFARLERVTQRVDSLSKLAASIRNDELVYKKAFARRCENLVLAETEVDLLGDQVEALQELLRKIYFVFVQSTSLLTHDFEVMDILKSIKKELN